MAGGGDKYGATARLRGTSVFGAHTAGKWYVSATFGGQSGLKAKALFLNPTPLEIPSGVTYATVIARPVSLAEDILDIEGIINRLAAVLSNFFPAKGVLASELRRAIGDLKANLSKLVLSGTIGTAMLNAFTAANAAGITINSLDRVLQQLLSETPYAGGPLAVVHAGMVYTLSSQCRLIAEMTFVSRDDVEAMQLRMRNSFDLVKQSVADTMDSDTYSKLLIMAGLLSRHLADTARPLPRLVNFELSPMPALALANRIYGDGSRWEELLQENRIIHPLFFPREIRALSV